MALHNETFELWLKVMRDLRRAYNQRAAELGLTMSRLRVLVVLSRMEGCTQSELAHALEIEVPTLKRQIDALEAEGFLRKDMIEGDVRKRALFLTDHAKSISVTKFAAKARQDLFTGFSEEELGDFYASLLRISDNVTRITDHE